MGLYEFLMQNKINCMNKLIDRNKRMPQQWYEQFFFQDNPDFNKSNMGICIQYKGLSLVQKMQNLANLDIKKAFDRNVLGRNIQDNQPRNTYEAWVTLFCRDSRAMAGIEKEIIAEEWKEIKDLKTRERYKETGDKFYELDRWVLTLLYNQQIKKNITTMIYRHPDQLMIDEYYHHVSVMLDWMITALKPHQQTQPLRKLPELEQNESGKEYLVIGENHPAAFAILLSGERAEARLEIGNVPNLSQDLINAHIIAMVDKNYSAVPLSGNRIGLAKRLKRKPADTEKAGIKMNVVNYAEKLVRRMEES